jgi:hypothetical protein
MRSNEIKKDWDERAFKQRITLSTTTDDIWLRKNDVPYDWEVKHR